MSNYVQFPTSSREATTPVAPGGGAFLPPSSSAQAIQPGSVTYTTTYDEQGQARYHPFVAQKVDYQTSSGLLTGIQWVPASPAQQAAAAAAAVPIVSPAQLQQATSVSQAILANVNAGVSPTGAMPSGAGPTRISQREQQAQQQQQQQQQQAQQQQQMMMMQRNLPPPPDVSRMSQREADKAMKAWDKETQKAMKKMEKEAAKQRQRQEESDRERMKAQSRHEKDRQDLVERQRKMSGGVAFDRERERKMSGGVAFDRERERKMSAGGGLTRSADIERQLAEMKLRGGRDRDKERERELERAMQRERKLSGGALGLSRDRSQATRRLSVSEVDRARRISGGGYDMTRQSWYPATSAAGQGGAGAYASGGGPYATPATSAATVPNGYPYSHSSGVGAWNPGTSPNAFAQPNLPPSHSPSRNPAPLSHSPYHHPASKQPSPRGASPFMTSQGMYYPPGHILAGQPMGGAGGPPGPPGPPAAPVYVGGGGYSNPAAPPPPGPPVPGGYGAYQPNGPASTAAAWAQQQQPPPSVLKSAKAPNPTLPYSPFEPFLAIANLDDLLYHSMPLLPMSLTPHDVAHEDWIQFWTLITEVWAKRGEPSHTKIRRVASEVADVVDLWNHKFFGPRRIEAVLFRGRERRTGPHKHAIESSIAFPHSQQYESSSDSSSSSSSSSEEDDRGYRHGSSAMRGQHRDQYMIDREEQKRQKKKEKRRKEKERKRRKAEEEPYSIGFFALNPQPGYATPHPNPYPVPRGY